MSGSSSIMAGISSAVRAMPAQGRFFDEDIRRFLSARKPSVQRGIFYAELVESPQNPRSGGIEPHVFGERFPLQNAEGHKIRGGGNVGGNTDVGGLQTALFHAHRKPVHGNVRAHGGEHAFRMVSGFLRFGHAGFPLRGESRQKDRALYLRGSDAERNVCAVQRRGIYVYGRTARRRAHVGARGGTKAGRRAPWDERKGTRPPPISPLSPFPPQSRSKGAWSFPNFRS